jgi:hypothetical protein
MGDPLAPLRDSARVLLGAAEKLLKVPVPGEPTLAKLQIFSDPQSHFAAMLEPITWRLENFVPSHSQNEEESERAAERALQAMGALNLFPPPRQGIQESPAPVQTVNRPKQKAEETKQDFFSASVEVRAPKASSANADQMPELKTEARPTVFPQTNRTYPLPSQQRFSKTSEGKVAGSSFQHRNDAWEEGTEAKIQSTSTAPRGVRMAQGAPRLAAILQANASGLEKIERPTLKNADSPAEQIAAESHPVKSESTPSRPIDLDELIKHLAEQLELDLIRTYGTSAR